MTVSQAVRELLDDPFSDSPPLGSRKLMVFHRLGKSHHSVRGLSTVDTALILSDIAVAYRCSETVLFRIDFGKLESTQSGSADSRLREREEESRGSLSVTVSL